MSKEIRTCQEFNVNRLFLFNSGYVLSIFDFHEDKYYKKYVESSKLPEELTEDSEEFKELERLIDINVEKYYKKYTDIEYKSKWDSPVAVLKELLKDLSIAIKYNREPDTVGEKELDKIINKYKNKPKPNYNKQFEDERIKGIKDGIIFGSDVKKDDSYYEQDENGIKYVNIIGNGDTPRITKIANLEIKNITMIRDELELFDPVYNITYNNLTINEEITKEYLTSKQLIDELQNAKVLYNPKEIEIKTLINCFIIDGQEYNKVKVKKEAYLKGFWMVDNKVISNTEIKDLKYNKEDLKKAIKLLNEVIKSRSKEGKRNDCTVYRFMLYSPFSYCLKQLGYGDSNYSLILTGASQTNKSGSIKIANHFYNHTEVETACSTVSVLGSKLEENSFPAILDECDHLFKLDEANNVIKRAIYELTVRATKDRNDNKKIDNFQALGLPVFLLNEPQKFKDYITNRYKVIHYSNKSIITDLNKKQFNMKYKPKSQYTPLKIFNVIGKAFSEKMIKILEDSEQHNKLFDIENTIISILQEIGGEAGIDFIKEMYEATIASTQYNYDVKEAIKEVLNNEFKNKNRLPANYQYDSNTFIKSITKNDFPFIYYNRDRTIKTEDRHYIIDTYKLVNYINDKINEYVEIDTILESLGLTEILQQRANENNKSYSEYIKSQINFTYKNKNKNVRGFYLITDEVINNLFSMDLDLTKGEDC
ncbi:MAG: hypothetical protein MJ224_04595 [archaeon]|nr:hypothetical protein [archaeon]